MVDIPPMIENMPPVLVLELIDRHLIENGTIQTSLLRFEWNISNDGGERVSTSANITNGNLSIPVCSSDEYYKECSADLILLGIQEGVPFSILLYSVEFGEDIMLIHEVNTTSEELVWVSLNQGGCLEEDGCWSPTNSTGVSKEAGPLNLAIPGLIIGVIAAVIACVLLWWRKKGSFLEDAGLVDEVPNPFMASKK